MRSYLGKGNHMSERITGHTELIGLMAYPIRHSSSPAMQNEAFAKLGYDYAYLAFEVDANEIEAGVQALRTLKMRGANISMPNKTLVGKYLDELTPAAQMCGAVNTVVNDNGHFLADWTYAVVGSGLHKAHAVGNGPRQMPVIVHYCIYRTAHLSRRRELVEILPY